MAVNRLETNLQDREGKVNQGMACKSDPGILQKLSRNSLRTSTLLLS